MMVRRLPRGGTGGFTPHPPYDEEFLGDGGAWTLTAILGGTLDINTTAPGKIHMPTGSAAHKVGLPSFPFTVTAFCSYILYDDINSVYANATLAISEASPAGSPGPLHWGLEWDVDILGSIAVYDIRRVSFGGSLTHLGTKQNETAGLTREVPHYQRIVAHSSTDYDLQWSLDGSSWTTYGTAFNPTLTAGAIMLISFGCTTEWDWIRFT